MLILGVFISKLNTILTKKWRGPTDDDLRGIVVIPKYLSEDMANAVQSEGTAVPKGPPLGEKIAAPACPILVFINSKSGGRLGPELMKHFEELISPNQVRISLILRFVAFFSLILSLVDDRLKMRYRAM